MSVNFRYDYYNYSCFKHIWVHCRCYNIWLRGHNWVYFAHRLKCTVTLDSNFAIIETWNCFQLE